MLTRLARGPARVAASGARRASALARAASANPVSRVRDDSAGVRPEEERSSDAMSDYMLFHPVYTQEALDVQQTHREPQGARDKIALSALRAIRWSFDTATGYGPNMTEEKYLSRFLFLETVAGVPGMVAGMLRHMRSLRGLKRDHGWIHTLLEEAENERCAAPRARLPAALTLPPPGCTSSRS